MSFYRRLIIASLASCARDADRVTATKSRLCARIGGRDRRCAHKVTYRSRMYPRVRIPLTCVCARFAAGSGAGCAGRVPAGPGREPVRALPRRVRRHRAAARPRQHRRHGPRRQPGTRPAGGGTQPSFNGSQKRRRRAERRRRAPFLPGSRPRAGTWRRGPARRCDAWRQPFRAARQRGSAAAKKTATRGRVLVWPRARACVLAPALALASIRRRRSGAADEARNRTDTGAACCWARSGHETASGA